MDSFWKHPDFWINLIVGLGGVVFAMLAYFEAKRAKEAANEAGKTVRIQTVTVELAELALKIDKIQPDILFRDARDLLTEISRRLRRATSPFAKDADFHDGIAAARAALDAATVSLKSVRPTDPSKEDETANTVYYGIESEFSVISNCVADLIGLFEMKSVATGDTNAKS